MAIETQVSSEIIAVLTKLSDVVHLKAGDVLGVSETPSADVVKDGEIKLVLSCNVVARFREGDYLPGLRDADAVYTSDEPASVWRVGRASLVQTLAGAPELLSRWLDWTDAALLESRRHRRSDDTADVLVTGVVQRFAAGDPIIHQGQRSDAVYELLEGRASVSMGGAAVGQIQSGEFFGEIGFLSDRPCNATVSAEEDCRVRIVKRDAFRRLVAQNPDMLIGLARTLALRVSSLDDDVFKLTQ